MKSLIEISGKNIRKVIGLMSGTSADGLDAALVEIRGSGTSTKLRLMEFVTAPYSEELKSTLLRNAQTGSSDVAEISQLNFMLARLSAEIVNDLVLRAGLKNHDVDLIGSHGHTIHHIPRPARFIGRDIASTLQIGDPSVIAKLTGIVTVGDFRVGDVALGGEGAPLVPYFDYVMYRSADVTRGLLNIGGIANITYLPKNCNADEVVAFDTGPGNMLVDQLMRSTFGKGYDDSGSTAFSGKIQDEILQQLLADEFVIASPPKSTGRERYGTEFLSHLSSRYTNTRREDLVATLSEFTARSIHMNYVNFLESKGPIDELYVSGGGAHNRFIFESLRRLFSPAGVEPVEKIGSWSDAKEAVCFALLANETLSGSPANLPAVTGASQRTVLGKICLP